MVYTFGGASRAILALLNECHSNSKPAHPVDPAPKSDGEPNTSAPKAARQPQETFLFADSVASVKYSFFLFYFARSWRRHFLIMGSLVG